MVRISLRSLASVLLGASLVANLASGLPNLEHKPLPLRTIHQFTNPTYPNDLVILSNGDMVVSSVWPNASVFYISVQTSPATASLIHTFDDLNAATSIIEMQEGVLALVGGNQTRLGFGIVDTFSIYEVDLRHYVPREAHADGNELELRAAPDNGAKISEILHIPGSGYIIGMEQAPSSPTTLLLADTILGCVWRVDTVTRKYEMVIQTDKMRGPKWAPIEFGIDGLHVHKGFLYWNIAYISTIYRVAITDNGYIPEGAEIEEVAATRTLYMDNFAIGPNGGDTIWAATNADNRLIAITPDGKTTVVAGEPNQMTLAGAVTGKFGRREGDSEILYVATGGALVIPVNGTVSEGGKVVAVDTRPFFE